MPKPQPAAPSGGQGRRRRAGQRVALQLSEINVIPLVDVMLVLLIVFMVAAPMMQQGFDVNLPVARRVDSISEERIFVTVPISYREDGRLQLGDDSVSLQVLEERVRQMMVARNEREVFLRGDGGVTLQELLDVMDQLRAGGVERVGIVARQVGQR